MFGLGGMKLYGIIGAGIVIGLFLTWVLRIDNLRAQHKKETAACQAAFEQFKADVRTRTELARISDAAHKAEVERDQEKVRAENDTEIRNAIAAARATAASVRHDTKVDSRRQRDAPMPGDTPAAERVDGGSEAPELAPDRMICAEAVVKAESWQSWYKEVAAIPR